MSEEAVRRIEDDGDLGISTMKEKEHSHPMKVLLETKEKVAALSLPSQVASGGLLQPFRLLSQDIHNLSSRYWSDWTVFNQVVFASAVYVFFTNLLPGITFASDLYVLTGKNWGTIEVVFSTGLCGVIFAL